MHTRRREYRLEPCGVRQNQNPIVKMQFEYPEAFLPMTVNGITVLRDCPHQCSWEGRVNPQAFGEAGCQVWQLRQFLIRQLTFMLEVRANLFCELLINSRVF